MFRSTSLVDGYLRHVDFLDGEIAARDPTIAREGRRKPEMS